MYLNPLTSKNVSSVLMSHKEIICINVIPTTSACSLKA